MKWKVINEFTRYSEVARMQVGRGGQDGIKACGDEVSEAGAGRVDGFDRAVLSRIFALVVKAGLGGKGAEQ